MVWLKISGVRDIFSAISEPFVRPAARARRMAVSSSESPWIWLILSGFFYYSKDAAGLFVKILLLFINCVFTGEEIS